MGLGLAVPALVIADREPAEGGTPPLQDETASSDLEEGKELFRQTCASCHTLAAANARGVTGPDLDEIGEMTEERVLTGHPGGWHGPEAHARRAARGRGRRGCRAVRDRRRGPEIACSLR